MPPKRARRTTDERIADLQAEIGRITARAAQQKAKKNPALRHISAAARAIDRATGVTRDQGDADGASGGSGHALGLPGAQRGGPC